MSVSPAAPNNIVTVRRVLAGTRIGTAIEWYDFFIYARLPPRRNWPRSPRSASATPHRPGHPGHQTLDA